MPRVDVNYGRFLAVCLPPSSVLTLRYNHTLSQTFPSNMMSENDFGDQHYIDCRGGMLFPLRAECVPATPVGTRRNSANTDTKRLTATKKRASNPSTPVSELQIFASASYWHVRKCVALNPTTPEFLLETLAVDDSPVVRKAVASRSDASVWILELVFRSSIQHAPNGEVGFEKIAVLSVLNHPRTPPDILQDVVVLHVNYNITSPLLNAAIAHPHRNLRLLRELARNSNRYIRLAVAKYAQRVDVLHLLLQDTDNQVHRIAAERLRNL